MRRFDSEMLGHFERKAMDDAGFAVAYSLLLISDEIRRYREEMTFGSGDGPNRYPGIGEKIGMELGNIAEQLGSIGERMPE